MEAKSYLLRLLPSVLSVLTVKKDDQITACVVSWMTQCSFKPPLLAVALREGSRAHAIVEKAGAFCVNFPKVSQKENVQKFFKAAQAVDGKISGLPYQGGAKLGFPVFPDFIGYLEAQVVEQVKKGDHHLFVGEILNAHTFSKDRPLLLSDTGWSYGG